MKQEQAETISIKVLSWLAEDGERLNHFLNASGAAVDSLRTRAQEPEFLGFILDFLMLDDQMILEFCAEKSEQPDSIQHARAMLTQEHQIWT